MTERDGKQEQDVDLLRMRLHQLVEDVEPRGDALPRLLAATRRRRLPHRRPLLAAGGAAVAATAVFLVALLVLPGDPWTGAEPVSVQPNSYVAEGEHGVVASFDVVSGRKLEEIGQVSGEVTGQLVADGQHVYAVVSQGARHEVVEVSGGSRVVSSLSSQSHGAVLTAGGGRVAYLDGDAVRIADGGNQRRIPVPSGITVVDLALDVEGRLAVLTTSQRPPGPKPGDPLTTDRVSGRVSPEDPNAGEARTGVPNAGDSHTGEPNAGESNAGESNAGESNAGDPNAGDPAAGEPVATAIHVVEPGAASMTDRPVLPPAGACGPLALAWSGQEVATVQPVDCGSHQVRVATLNRDNGEQVGAGAPFDAGRLEAGQVQLSTDRLGRFLLATSEAKQWLVDGADVLPVPSACPSCAGVPSTFWG